MNDESKQLGNTRDTARDIVLAVDLNSPDSIMRARCFVSAIGDLHKWAKAFYEQRLVDLLSDGEQRELIIDNLRFYLARDKTTKCKDHAATLEAVFIAVGGDPSAVARHLSSNAWKPGGLREVLADKWGECFEVIETTTVREGKPNRNGKTLHVVDERFIPTLQKGEAHGQATDLLADPQDNG